MELSTEYIVLSNAFANGKIVEVVAAHISKPRVLQIHAEYQGPFLITFCHAERDSVSKVVLPHHDRRYRLVRRLKSFKNS